jgi:hypothetical protein
VTVTHLQDVDFKYEGLRIPDTCLPLWASTSTVFRGGVSSSRAQMVANSVGQPNSNHVDLPGKIDCLDARDQSDKERLEIREYQGPNEVGELMM